MTTQNLLQTIIINFINGDPVDDNLEDLEFLDERYAEIVNFVIGNDTLINILYNMTLDRRARLYMLTRLIHALYRNELVLTPDTSLVQEFFTAQLQSFNSGAGPSSGVPQMPMNEAPTENNTKRKRNKELFSEEEEISQDFVGTQLVSLKNISPGEICSICHENLHGNGEVCRLYDCGHIFHYECIIKTRQRTCPLCRTWVDRIIRNVNLNLQNFGKKNNKLSSDIKYLKSIKTN
jgi:hypothetical protein